MQYENKVGQIKTMVYTKTLTSKCIRLDDHLIKEIDGFSYFKNKISKDGKHDK